MEKTKLCNLIVCCIKNRDKGGTDIYKFSPISFYKNDYMIHFKIVGFNQELNYNFYIKSGFNPDDNKFINWEEVFNNIQKEYYIGCNECMYSYKYMLTKKCDKVFQLNSKVCEWKGYGGKRSIELKQISEDIRKEMGDAFFKL